MILRGQPRGKVGRCRDTYQKADTSSAFSVINFPGRSASMNQVMVILHGIFKKTRKTPRKDLHLAQIRRDIWLRGGE